MGEAPGVAAASPHQLEWMTASERGRGLKWLMRARALVVVAENHSVIGGLGEAVASALLRHRVQPAGFHLAGLPDAYLDAGALPTLHDRYGISRDALAQRIKNWLG